VKGRHFWSDDDQSRVQRSRLLERTSVPSFQVGETLLLRDANLKRFDTPVEFRALEEDRALVLIRGHFVVVPLVSLRRPDGLDQNADNGQRTQNGK
jgi:hypothetical protein